MHTRTKIICTIGPAVDTYEKILELMDAGMNVARLNFSHGTHEQHLRVIEMLKRARRERSAPLAIMLDTKGPEIRVGSLQGELVHVAAGQRLRLVKESKEGVPDQLPIVPGLVLDALEEGMTVLFDDGYVSAFVLERAEDGVLIEMSNAGIIKSRKGVNVPNAAIDLPAMTEQDVKDITFGCAHDVDLIAASFIRSADHVLEIKRLLIAQGKPDILVIAKIENSQGVQHFDSIVQAADGIMVARGDLGVELPLRQVPALQKMMIRKCYQASKPVVTATQMLESMIHNPRPTRAEVSDVANAIYDSTSAVMLSGETAVGRYPIEAVKMMKSIIEETEKDFLYRDFFAKDSHSETTDISAAVSLSSVKTAYGAGAQAIFAFTSSGATARLISRFRPQMPILALSPHVKTYHQMAFNWGVIPVEPVEVRQVQDAFQATACFAMKKGVVHYGDLVVVTAGSPFGVSGTTNMMMVESIGDVLVRGYRGEGKQIHGRIACILSPDEHNHSRARGRILVLSRCDERYNPLLKQAIGVVLQNLHEDLDSEQYALAAGRELHIPVVIRADNAFTLLQEGVSVTLDPQKAIVYKGSVGSNEEMTARVCAR
jgi:pyruvate kinase